MRDERKDEEESACVRVLLLLRVCVITGHRLTTAVFARSYM